LWQATCRSYLLTSRFIVTHILLIARVEHVERVL